MSSNVIKVVIAASIGAQTPAVKMDVQAMMAKRAQAAQERPTEVYDDKFKIPEGLPAEL